MCWSTSNYLKKIYVILVIFMTHSQMCPDLDDKLYGHLHYKCISDSLVRHS